MDFVFAYLFIYNIFAVLDRFGVLGFTSFNQLYMCLLIIAAVLFVVFHAFRSVGLYTLAKKNDIKSPWRACIPFASTLVMGELAGETSLFGKKIKKIGVWLLVLEIVYFAITAIGAVGEMTVSEYISITEQGGYVFEAPDSSPIWNMYYVFFQIGVIGSYIMSIFFTLGLCIALIAFFRNFVPRSAWWYAVVSIFFPTSPFFIFAIRDKERIDYAAYVKAQQEAYIRRQQQYYNNNPYNNPNNPYGNPYNNPNNPYGNPYNNPNNPYGNPYNNPNAQPPDPFAEFGSKPNPNPQPPFNPFGNGQQPPDPFASFGAQQATKPEQSKEEPKEEPKEPSDDDKSDQ